MCTGKVKRHDLTKDGVLGTGQPACDSELWAEPAVASAVVSTSAASLTAAAAGVSTFLDGITSFHTGANGASLLASQLRQQEPFACQIPVKTLQESRKTWKSRSLSGHRESSDLWFHPELMWLRAQCLLVIKL